ncbi:MAG: hypothetical protein GEEBNDBF_01607 [bacterium]|nr:hypothetical protein [bacterium]
MPRALVILWLLVVVGIAPLEARPGNDVVVGLEQLAGESAEAYYDRLFVQCGSWLPPYEAVKDDAKARLIALGPAVLASLVPTWYASTNVRHRVTLEEIIRGIGVPAVPYLLPHLGDPDPVMRQRILTSLGELDDAAVLPALEARLTLEGDVQVLPSLLDAIGRRGAGIAHLVPQIAALLDHDDERVRRSGAVALGRIGEGAGVEVLRPLLSDPLFSVRAPAQEALWGLLRAAPSLPDVPEVMTSRNLSIGEALWLELDIARCLLSADQRDPMLVTLASGLNGEVASPRERIAMLRGIRRAWQNEQSLREACLPVLERPQSAVEVEGVRREVLGLLGR